MAIYVVTIRKQFDALVDADSVEEAKKNASSFASKEVDFSADDVCRVRVVPVESAEEVYSSE